MARLVAALKNIPFVGKYLGGNYESIAEVVNPDVVADGEKRGGRRL
jgi:hypothetical protein